MVKKKAQTLARPPRRDLEIREEPALIEALASSIGRLAKEGRPDNESRPDPRFRVRKALIESDKSDPNGYERVLGISDLLSINFLGRAQRAARTVCRITIPGPGGPKHGTGFLVAPQLLMTNNHVLGTTEEAGSAHVEFDYEHDFDGALNQGIHFSLREGTLFYTDVDLDFTMVAVAPHSANGVPIERFGYIPLIPRSGKAVHGERVTIVQHPGGQPKQIAIHSSRIIELPRATYRHLRVADFIHYTTDTEPGSSGAPVFNDQWQVVALHHKAVPAAGQNVLSSEGRVRYEDIKWIANEGVRISAIYSHLQAKRFVDAKARSALERVETAIGLPRSSPVALGNAARFGLEADRRPHDLQVWQDLEAKHSLGFKSDFITFQSSLDDKGLDIVEILGKKSKPFAAEIGNSQSVVIAYLHFSIVFHKQRRFPLLTAVNIDGSQINNPGSRSKAWRRDARLDERLQPAGNFYEVKAGDDPVQFSRGHMVRRADPCWGTDDEAKMAEEHTFHYTNAAPQVQRYNDVDWGNLEDHLLDIAQREKARMSVLTGPVFRINDPIYGARRTDGPWQVPTSYWKVAIIQRKDQSVRVAAFLVGQVEYIRALYETKAFSSLTPYSVTELKSRHIQTSLATIAEEAKMNFSMLLPYEVSNGAESTRFITEPGQIRL